MQDREELLAIDGLGEEEEEFLEPWDEAAQESSEWDGVPLLQAVICALLIVGLVYCKLAQPEHYDKVTQWYRQEMSQEIELPQLTKPTPAATATPEPVPSETPPPAAGLDNVAAHLL